MIFPFSSSVSFSFFFIGLFISETKHTMDYCLNPSSPNRLHPRENLSLLLVSLSFNETNYQSLSRNMRHALLQRINLSSLMEVLEFLNAMI